MKTIYSGFAFLCILFLSQTIAVAQDDSPVYAPWGTSILIDNQTVVSPEAGTFEARIHHRFGKIEELSDLFGIYAPSNIRLGINYGITDKIMIGFGTEKNNKAQQFQAKYALLQQTESGSKPVSLSVYANTCIDSRDKAAFGKDYTFSNRLSYFAQLIVSRKFNDRFSLQLAPSFSHFNAVESTTSTPSNDLIVPKWKNDVVGAMVGGRAVLYNDIAFTLEYNQPILINDLASYQLEPKAGIGFGLEKNTGTHCFQVFASNYDKIIGQHNLAYNLKEMGDLMFGFNISVRF